MRSARWLPLLLVVVVLPLLIGTAVVVVAESRTRGERRRYGGPRGGHGALGRHVVLTPPTMAREVLADWDARRADAWATGDAVALSGLYVPSSVAGRRDVAMLRGLDPARAGRPRPRAPRCCASTYAARSPSGWCST